jgi:hypothetical protein
MILLRRAREHRRGPGNECEMRRFGSGGARAPRDCLLPAPISLSMPAIAVLTALCFRQTGSQKGLY